MRWGNIGGRSLEDMVGECRYVKDVEAGMPSFRSTGYTSVDSALGKWRGSLGSRNIVKVIGEWW